MSDLWFILTSCFRVAELDQVTEERNEARKEHEELRRQRLEMFMDGFGAITLKLKEMYQMITLGGDAELELVDSLDPFSQPTGCYWRMDVFYKIRDLIKERVKE